MVDVEDAHVGAAAHAALLDSLRGLVEEAHEGDGAGGAAVGAAHARSAAAELREVETGAAAALVDQHLFAQGLADAVHGILHADHEAGCQLSVGCLASGVHERGAVRHKEELGHDVVVFVGPLVLERRRLFRRGDMGGYAHEHLLRRLLWLTVGILPEITVSEDVLRGFVELRLD